MQKEMYRRQNATVSRAQQITKRLRFNLSYYDLHTADAHIDLFELEVKRRAESRGRGRQAKKNGEKSERQTSWH